MKRYSHDNWNQVFNLPDGDDKKRQLRIVGTLAKGNLHWFVRRLIGGISDDEPEWVKKSIKEGEMLERSDFLRTIKTYEDTLGIY